MVRPRFSLRTLLLAMGVAAAVFAYVGHKIRVAEERREFSQEAQLALCYRRGESSIGLGCGFDPPPWYVEWFGTVAYAETPWASSSHVTDEHLHRLTSFDELLSIHIASEKITDAGLLELAALKNLRHVRIESPRITADGEQRLRAALPDCRVEITRSR
jgi:hypothetical protein